MTSLTQLCTVARSWRIAVVRSGAVFLSDAGHGLLEVAHNSLALFGLLVLGGRAVRVEPARTSATRSRRRP